MSDDDNTPLGEGYLYTYHVQLYMYSWNVHVSEIYIDNTG